MQNDSNSLMENRQIRIFVSSTFKDMNEVRSHLAINVFPYIRKQFIKKGINFSWIDLRWGITNEEAQAGLVIPKCLQAMNDCNVFIGIIGDYYGTTLCKDDIESLNVSEETKVQIIDYLDLLNNDGGISITEMEIFHGVINNRRIQNSCFFIKENKCIEDPRINKLIQKIKQGGYTCHDFSSNEQLGRLLTDYLSNIFQTHHEDDELHKESLVQQTILESYLDDYHSDEEFEELNWKLNRIKWDNNRGFYNYNRFYHDHNHAIVGEWGCGKSSFIANWINRIEKNNEYNIVYYFVNTLSSYSTPIEIANYLSYMILKLNEYNDKIKVSELSESPIDRLHQLLSLTHLCISKPLVIVLDGVENLKDNTESYVFAKSLEWVGFVHPNVFFVISAKNDDYSILHFRDLKIKIQECPNFKEELVKEFIDNYLTQCHKNINGDYLDRIVDSPVLKYPLLLRRFLDLLIACDNNDSLDNTINEFVLTTTRQTFIALYFEKLSTYFPHCYRELLYYLAISRNGLYGLELGVLLQEKQVLPTMEIMKICAMLDDFIVSNGVDNIISTNCHISFKNNVVKEAVCKNLIDNDLLHLYRRKILETITKDQFVNTYGDRIHLYSEFLHQLYELQEFGSLYNNIFIPDLFLKMRNSKDFIKYWTALYNRNCSLLGYFKRDVINNLSDDLFISYATKVLLLAQNIGNYTDSILIVQTVIDSMADRHMMEIDQNGCFCKLSAEIANLMTIIFEIANDNHMISNQIYLLYQPLLLTLQNNDCNIESKCYLHNYTYVLYCDTLIVLAGRNQETNIFKLLQKIIHNNTIEQNISYEQKKYVEIMADITLLKLASISSQYYHSFILKSVLKFGNVLETAIATSASLSISSKARTAQLYLFAYRIGMPVWNNDSEYLETAINMLNEIEIEGGVNVNKYLVLCYSDKIRRYRQNDDNAKVEQYKALLYKRLYDNNNNPRWDIPPYIWNEIEEVVDIHPK